MNKPLVFDQLKFRIDAGANIPLLLPMETALPELFYEFDNEGKNYMFQVFPYNVAILTITDSKSTSYLANVPLKQTDAGVEADTERKWQQ